MKDLSLVDGAGRKELQLMLSAVSYLSTMHQTLHPFKQEMKSRDQNHKHGSFSVTAYRF